MNSTSFYWVGIGFLMLAVLGLHDTDDDSPMGVDLVFMGIGIAMLINGGILHAHGQ